MVTADKRRSLILSTAGHFFGVPVQDSVVPGSSALERFLDEAACRTICFRSTHSEFGLKLTNELASGKNALIFFKLAASAVTEENFHDLVQVVSTGSGESSTLIEALRQVWCPILESSGVSRSFLKRLEEDLLGPRPPSSIAEEEAFWARKRDGARGPQERRVAEEAVAILRRTRIELESAAASREGLLEVEETLEAASGHLDDLWKLEGPAYSEDRIKLLLDIIGDEIVVIVESLVSDSSSSASPKRTRRPSRAGRGTRALTNETALMGATVCDKWTTVSERLTGLFWPHQSLHPWRGPPFVPRRCAKLGKRLRQVAEFRAQHRQLTRLLTPGERAGLRTDDSLQAFDDVRASLGDDERDLEWDRLRREIEEGLVPAEERVAEKLRAQMAGASDPTSLVAEFQRYGQLLKRDGLRRALRSEREALLSSLPSLIELHRTGPDTENLLDSPRILQNFQAVRASELRLESLRKLGEDLLADLPGYQQAISMIGAALKDAESRRQHLIESWINETRATITKKELSLGTDTTVVELTGASMMRVTYDMRLVTLVREARALAGQGVELPREVRDLAERAGSLASRARALQQVATFHNTIGDRMVPSQRPLMLTAALELARAVREQSGVVWSDPQAVDGYTARLRELVRRFARQNSELAAKHSVLRDAVAGLFKGEGSSLLENQNVWKDTLRRMRSIIDTVEIEYGNTRAWKLHWDRQLLKVLGVAYRTALPTLMRKLTEIKVELTFRDGSLRWRPPLEEIRAKLYSGLRRFLVIPINFRGVGDTADGNFDDLVRRSAYLYGSVYIEAEAVLSTVEATRTKWMPLAAPARFNDGERLKGKSPQEWEKAFKDAKQWAQEVGKLRGGTVKVRCISIDTGTTRNDLESASRRCWDQLSSNLRVEASSRLTAATEFLSSAARELDRRPRNVEEIGIARETHSRIRQESTGVAEELEAVAGLARILAAWTRENLEGVSGASAAWEGLKDRLERHRAVMTRQLEDARINLRHGGATLRDERERWLTRWSSKPEVVTADWIASMRERLVNLTDRRKSLEADCRRIGLDIGSVLEEDEPLAELEVRLEIEESNCRIRNEFLEELRKQEAEEWSVARRRLPRLHGWLDSWESRLQDRRAIEGPETGMANVDALVSKKVRQVRSAVEWVQLLRGDELAEEHWVELRPILDLTVIDSRDITLGHLLSRATVIEENVDRIKEVIKKAMAESGIRQALSELETWESSASLNLRETRDSRNTGVLLVGEYGGLLSRAGELRLLMEGARGTVGYERFADRAARCEAALSELEERIKALNAVQRKWVYLEPIYGGGAAAPNDSGRWTRADKEFRYVMGEIVRDPGVASLRRLPLPALISLRDLLDRCQRSLDEFLEEKRSSYPRLYFLSDEDLLELVSGSGRGLDAHLPKLYHGIGTVRMENGLLTAVTSPEGESLRLPEPIDLNDPLSRWLSNLEEGMRDALRQHLEECLSDSVPDPSRYPAQVLLLSGRIRFTEHCETALKRGHSGLRSLVETLEAQRAEYRGLENAGDRLTVLKARGLLLDTVHHLEVARTLLGIVARGERASWAWSRQLRSYRSNRGPIIRCAGAEFPYRFEYQGAGTGLVRTPLTERCFLALAQGMKLGLGGSPTGPAGTGKTESVKALGAVLGRLVLVFNCDEGMDAGSMRRILGGLAQAGAWGCFDEFNRLEEETLSALAMLVRPLQEAIRDGRSVVRLGDREIALDPHCCIFITMNPANAEYGGRHKLPDSLARLFRPVAMAHPDRSDIARALLECAGFLEASALSRRLVEVLDISEKLLLEQPHYDWGLRALRSVLDAVPPPVDSSEPASEIVRLLTAIRASTLPKLTEEDTPKFLALLSDVFPEANTATVPSTVRQDLRSTLDELCDAQSLVKEVTTDRCVQLWDQLRSRTGVAIVGPPGSGKSLIRVMLADALARLGESVTQYLVYPGAMPKTRLLGRVDPRTREWKEGLLPVAVSSASSESATWIVLDGNVEPGWAEALNSALDDNRLLTLSNGVAVRLNSGTRFIFETDKLDGASPATVSRLGVVHLGSTMPSTLFVPSRLEVLSPPAKDVVTTCLGNGFDIVLKSNEERSSASGLMTAVMSHLRRARTRTMGTCAVTFSLCGQIEDPETRDRLARLIYQSTDCRCPDPQRPFAALYNSETDRLEPFHDTAESIDLENGSLLLSGPIERALAAISPWIDDGCPVIVRGPAGSGKSSLVKAALSGREPSTVLRGSCVYGTQDLISRLKRACVPVDSSSQGRTYRPRNGGRLILVMEDLQLASKDLQELIRQLLQQGGFHEEDLEFAKVALTIVCTADSTAKLNPRLEALMAAHHLPNPSLQDTVAIVELHLRSALTNSSVKSWISRAASAMVETFEYVSSARETTALVRWTPRDLALWADALKFYPIPENDAEVTRHLLDAGRRLFHSRLTVTELSRWESIITSRLPEAKGHDVYAWNGIGLLAFSEEQWTAEVQAGAVKCVREGELVEAPIMSSHFLQSVADVSWALGSGLQCGLVLIGRAGTGRRSATKLAAAIASLRVVDSGPGRGRAAVRIAVQAAGIDGEPTLLLLEEHHVREEGLAILANALASKGELPGLLTSEELDALVAPLADLARREDFAGTLEQFLHHRLRNLLRVVVILDVLDEGLLSYAKFLRQCIGLGRESEWWTLEESLIELATLRRNKVQDRTEGETRSLGVRAAVKAHLRAPRQQRAPARFLALLRVWEDLKERRAKEIEEQFTSLEAGIDRLREAGERVAKLENEASKQRRELEAEKGRATAALEQITATMRGATGQRGEMTTLKAETERESAELARRKADIEGELGKVEPLVEQAAQAVAGIGADALAEVRSLRAPPAPVRDVLEGVLRLMGIRDTSWNSMKTFLAKRGVKDEIRTWDARRSSASSLEAVAKLVKERPDSFEERTAKRASVAAAPLAAWVLANLQYGQILQQVAPLEREQRLLAERLSIAEAQIGQLEAGLSSVEDRVARLQQELAEHSRGAATLQLRTETTEASLATSRALLEKLDKEHSDWQAQCERLATRKMKLDVETANAAALLVYQYLGKADKWKKLALDLLTNERERLLWRAQGLPGDTESLVGASCALRGPLVPLFVDSAGVAVAWLKSHVGPALEVTEPEEARFLTSLELAVRFGKPLLVQELVELPSVLLPLLRRRPLRLGDRTLLAQQGFQLFLATRRDSLERLPSEADSVIFKVTLGAGVESLAERFVEKALLRETPELEGRRREALEQEERLAGERDMARQDLLAQLGAARGQDLLREAQESQGGLLASLEATQSKAREISLALEKSRQSLEEVAKRARIQEPLARFAARLFEAVKALTSLSRLYVFSVEAFTDLYLEAVDASKSIHAELETGESNRTSIIEKRLIALTLHHCTKATYRVHRLPVALHLAMSLHPEPEIERKLLFGEVTTDNEETSDFGVPNWVPEERRSTVKALARALPQVGSRLRPAWLENVGNIYADNSLTPFQKVLVIRALRPDHLHTALSKLAVDRLGVRDVAPPSWSLAKVAEDPSTRPVLLLLSPGADPSPELSALAASRTAGPMEFTEVSLGQGQLSQAEAALETVCKNGGWLLLSNLQLALNWSARLEGLLRSPMCTSERDTNSRIWLTTEECPDFCSGLAGLCTKLAYEPPEGVKRNVERSLRQLKQLSPRNAGKADRTLLLAWLHAILQERRRFVPQSWTRAYEWNESDLEAAIKLIVDQATDRRNEINVENIGDLEADRGLLDVAVYGGRLQDAYDTRAFRSILKDVWSKEVFDGRRKLGGVLGLPEASAGDTLRAVERLGDLDSPRDYFGLPANIHGAWERVSAEMALALLKGIARRDAGDGKERTNEQLVAGLRRELTDLVDRGTSTSDRSTTLANHEDSPLERFLADERNSTKRLLSLVRTEVDALKNAKLDAFSQTPRHWLAKWPGAPLEILPFARALVSRHAALISSVSSSTGPEDLTYKVDLSWLARPRALLAALKQQAARQSGCSPENLRLCVDWSARSDKANKWSPSVIIRGLLVSGAAIRDGTLTELDADAAPIAAAPACQVAFVREEPGVEEERVKRGRMYPEGNDEEDRLLEIPVYADSRRNFFICALPVGCPREDRDVWLRRGVAFYLRSS